MKKYDINELKNTLYSHGYDYVLEKDTYMLLASMEKERIKTNQPCLMCKQLIHTDDCIFNAVLTEARIYKELEEELDVVSRLFEEENFNKVKTIMDSLEEDYGDHALFVYANALFETFKVEEDNITRVISLLDSGVKPIIMFNDGIEDTENLYDPEMITRVESYTLDVGGVVILNTNFRGFVYYNKTKEKKTFYDTNNKPVLGWSESNFYPRDFKEKVYLMNDSTCFKILSEREVFENKK